MKKFLLYILLISAIIAGKDILAQKKKPQKKSTAETSVQLNFKAGSMYHLDLKEILYLRQQSSQVDSESVEPAWRMTQYHFTETIEKVNPDGSALIGATLDSLTTSIIVGKYDERNEFFRFNSNNDYDVKNRLRDIRSLPRAQFLGQTLRYTLGPDGLVKNFQNLSNFREANYARSFDYDMLHAMMSLADSLRLGQFFEYGFGAIAALSAGNNGKIETPYTMTEIHVTRNISASRSGNEINFTSTFSNIPDSIDYLEGIAFPMNVEKFIGSSSGKVMLKEGMPVSGTDVDTAKLNLTIPGDTIKCNISRRLTFLREPIKVLRGGSVNIKELEVHHTPVKEEIIEYDLNGREIKRTPVYDDSTATEKKKGDEN